MASKKRRREIKRIQQERHAMAVRIFRNQRALMGRPLGPHLYGEDHAEIGRIKRALIEMRDGNG